MYLLAATSVLIAGKYEEVDPPTIRDCMKITHNKFNRNMILEMELSILDSAEYGMLMTSSYRFLERWTKVAKSDQIIFNIAYFFLELALFDSKMSQYCPSLQAASALYTAMRLIVT